MASRCAEVIDDLEVPSPTIRFTNSSSQAIALSVQDDGGYVEGEPFSPEAAARGSCGDRIGAWFRETEPLSPVVVYPGGALEHTWLATRRVERTVAGPCAEELSEGEDPTCAQRVALEEDALEGFVLAFRGERCEAPLACVPNEDGWCESASWAGSCHAVELREVAVRVDGRTCGVAEIDLAEAFVAPACGPTPWCAEACPVASAPVPFCGAPCEAEEGWMCGKGDETLRCQGGTWTCETRAPAPGCPSCYERTASLPSGFVLGCTQAGCEDFRLAGLTIEVGLPLRAGRYAFELDDAPLCELVVPEGCTETSCISPEGSTCSSNAGLRFQEPQPLQVQAPLRPAFDLRLSIDGEVAGEVRETPVISAFTLNGPACGPICMHASVRLDLGSGE